MSLLYTSEFESGRSIPADDNTHHASQTAKQRREVREHYNIEGSMFADYCAAANCQPCVLAQ